MAKLQSSAAGAKLASEALWPHAITKKKKPVKKIRSKRR